MLQPEDGSLLWFKRIERVVQRDAPLAIDAATVRPQPVRKDYWKLYVRMPKPSLVRKYRSIARQLLDICQKKPRYRSR